MADRQIGKNSHRMWCRLSDAGLFQLYSQSIGNAVDIGVVGADLDDMQDIDVGESRLAQRIAVVARHGGWCLGEFDDEFQHRIATLAQARLAPVILYLN